MPHASEALLVRATNHGEGLILCIDLQEAKQGQMDCRSLVEEEAVDVNLRDTWDAVPLYYACLAGQPAFVETAAAMKVNAVPQTLF